MTAAPSGPVQTTSRWSTVAPRRQERRRASTVLAGRAWISNAISLTVNPWRGRSTNSEVVSSSSRVARSASSRGIQRTSQLAGWPSAVRSRSTYVVFATGIGHGGGVGLPDEHLVIDGGGRLPGLRELERFCVDFVLDFASS